MSKKISVVIPTFNRKDTLKTTLLSFKGQTFSNFEIIVADDGSTDGTGEMVKSLNLTFPIKHLWHKNAGRSATRNMGIKFAEGEVILFIDDHIILDKNFIEEHVNYHNKFRGANICAVKGRVEFIEDPGQVPKKTKYFSESEIKKYPGEQNPLRVFYTHNLSVRKEALLKVGSFDEDFKEYGFQDQELGYRLRKAGYRFKYNPNAVGYIFSVKTVPENRYNKYRQAGHSAVIFFRKHPFYAFFNIGVNPVNTLLYFILSINNNWWLKKAERKLSQAQKNGNIQQLKKYKNRIIFFYFLLGIHEKLFSRQKE